MLLGGLDAAYDPIVTVLTATLAEIPMSDFQAHLLAYDMRLESQQSLLQSNTIARLPIYCGLLSLFEFLLYF